MTLTPPVAHFVKLDGGELDLPVEDLAVKDKLRVRPGENIPTDGIVLEGRSSVDESMITGEANLSDKSAGDTVIGGTTNQNGNLTIEATRVGKDTIVARIVKLVAAAQRSRPKVQQQVDKIASYFVPTVAIIAAVTFVAWATFGPPPTLAFALVSAIAVLIIACPCALGLATPMSIMVAIGRGARAGVLIRDAQALEKLSEIKVLVVDKTGTLTEGRPSVTKVLTQGKWAEGQVMMLAAAVESNSEHPVARAFVDYADSKDLADCKSSNFSYQPGGGVTANADGRVVAIGSARFLRETITTCKIDLEKTLARLEPEVEAMTREGNTPVMVAVDDELVALITMTDKVRANAKATVEELNQLGISLRMLTGDQEATARYVANQLGITEVMSEVSPLQKYDYIIKLQQSHGANTIAMAGDGINDAPALAQAGVAIAMGSGTNIAIESADIVLAHGDLSGILRAVRLSYAMKANIKQNLILAFGYNALAVPLAAGVLYPFTGLLLNPMLASLAMAFSSVSVITNALRLRRTPL
jgi:Cu+-exporting ATPase